MHALLPHAPTYGIEPRHLLAVIDGCQMDLEQSRYLDFAGLARYCDLVAGVVGEVAANIFGRTLASTVDYAHRLGLAMQLTNIVRDVGDDARRNRIYLPMSELKQFDVKAAELLERRYSERFTALMRFQAERAHRTYDEALALLGDADRAAQKPGLMMANIYRTLLREIEDERLRRAAPAHLADADPKALDRDADQLARSLDDGGRLGAGPARDRRRRRRLGRPRRGGRGVRRRRARHAVRDGARRRAAARATSSGTAACSTTAQHICIGAYVETLRLLADVGVDAAATFAADAADPGRRRRPGPAHARRRRRCALSRAQSLGRRGWSWRERFALLRTAARWQPRRLSLRARCDRRVLAAALPAAVRARVHRAACASPR